MKTQKIILYAGYHGCTKTCVDVWSKKGIIAYTYTCIYLFTVLLCNKSQFKYDSDPSMCHLNRLGVSTVLSTNLLLVNISPCNKGLGLNWYLSKK